MSAAVAAQPKIIDHLVIDKFNKGKYLVLELPDTEDENNYRNGSSVIYQGVRCTVKKMVPGRFRRISLEL
jgi:hypothetical protein